MARDIRHLVRAIGAPDLEYRDLQARSSPRRAHGRFTTIAIAGDERRTFFAANLAAALARKKQRVALFALDAFADVPEVPGVPVLFGDAHPQEECDIAVLDSDGETPLAEADEALIVLDPRGDVARWEALLARCRPGWRRSPAHYAVCGFDARRPDHREGLRRLRATLGDRFLDPPVHHEPARIAPPLSQAAADLDAAASAILLRRRDAFTA